MSRSEDEDVKRAIAFSLQDETHQEVINLESETEVRKNSLPKNASSGSPSAPCTSTSFLGMDRRRMEQERLARKRKRSNSPCPLSKSQKIDHIMQTDDGKSSIQPSKSTAHAIPETSVALSSHCKQDSRLTFPNGVVKRTWAFGHVRTGNEIKLEEVLQKNDLNLAVLSSFQWEIEWLLAKVDTRSTQFSFTANSYCLRLRSLGANDRLSIRHTDYTSHASKGRRYQATVQT